jgi:hypothetical protein
MGSLQLSKLFVNNIYSKTGASEALNIDSTGRVTTPSRPAFNAYKSGAAAWQSFGGTSATIMPFDATFLNVGNCYDTTNYKFVVPVDGIYTFYFQFYGDSTANDAFIRVDGTNVVFSRTKTSGVTVTANYVGELNVGQEVTAIGKVNSSDTQDWYGGHPYSFFQGYLVG